MEFQKYQSKSIVTYKILFSIISKYDAFKRIIMGIALIVDNNTADFDEDK